MRKLILVSSVALLALSGAALAKNNGRGNQNQHGNQSQYNAPVFNTGTLSGQFTYQHTQTRTNTQSKTYSDDHYTGFQSFTSAEHNGGVDIKQNGGGAINAVTTNTASANANGYKTAPVAGYTTTVTQGGGCSILGCAHPTTTTTTVDPIPSYNALSANNAAFSSSTVTANLTKAGSASGSAGGYSKAGSGARDEWGNSSSVVTQQQWQTNNNYSGSASITSAR